MSSFQWLRPTGGVLVLLYLCLSSFVLHFCVFNIPYPPHQDTNLILETLPENDTTDPHPDEDDIKYPGELIPGIELRKSAHEWASFLPTRDDGYDRLTPPPKFN
jgi:hypothetical protein